LSSGHTHKSKRTAAELDALLDNALAEPKIKARWARPYKLDRGHDIPLLGSSSIGGKTVYLSRNLPAYLQIDGKRVETAPPLIRHERIEQACEDELGYGYELSHEIATRWEHRWLTERKIDPAEYEAALAPYIRRDESEKLEKVPTDLDLRPELAPPKDTAMLARIRAAQAKDKAPQAVVDYVDKSQSSRRCGLCSMYVYPAYGGPGCTLVKDPINPHGYCKRFKAGELGA
jgi:hypothetical protein